MLFAIIRLRFYGFHYLFFNEKIAGDSLNVWFEIQELNGLVVIESGFGCVRRDWARCPALPRLSDRQTSRHRAAQPPPTQLV